MRKSIDYTVQLQGRDHGKVFELTEMAAAHAERWSIRAFRSLAASGVDLGEVQTLGMESIALLGMQALSRIPFEEASPLLDEMFECVRIKPDPKHPNVVRPLVEDDIEEVATRLILRMEVFKMHLNPSKAGDLSTSA